MFIYIDKLPYLATFAYSQVANVAKILQQTTGKSKLINTCDQRKSPAYYWKYKIR